MKSTERTNFAGMVKFMGVARWAILASVGIAIIQAGVVDADVWWRLGAGRWLVEHQAWPTTDPFSREGHTLTWLNYSWLFDGALYEIYLALGPAGLPLFTALFAVAILASLYGLLRQVGVHPGLALLAMLLASMGLARTFAPRPWLVSMLLFIVELRLLYAARISGSVIPLYWLWPLFAVWVNLHVQFIYGLIVLIFALGEASLPDACRRSWGLTVVREPSWPAWWLVTGGVFLATLVNPYHYHLYDVLFLYSGQIEKMDYLPEVRALAFRNDMDWLLLGCVLATTFRLGWLSPWRNAKNPRWVPIFEYLWFLFAIYVSFKSRRDLWMVQISALVLLFMPRHLLLETTEEKNADSLEATTSREGWRWMAAGALAVVGVVLGVALNGTNQPLRERLAKEYPAAAVAFIRENQCDGPLFNTFNWGGYIIWELPHLPVSMDGRTNVYGLARIGQSLRTWYGQPGWRDDPQLASARLVLAPRRAALTELLRGAPGWRVAFEDTLSVVFVAIDEETVKK